MNISSSEDTKELLFQLCKNGSLTTVQQLLSQHSDLLVQIDSLTHYDGNTALMVASENGHAGIVKLLLEYGANVNQKSSTYYGWTALTKASEKGDSNLEVIDQLLRHGAQVDLQNNGGFSALIVAAQNSQAKLAAKLVQDHGTNIDLKNNRGVTALIMASQVGCTEIVKLLLDHGAGVDKQNNDEWTALMMASYIGHHEVVKLLLEFGANVNIKANNYETAVILASQEKHNKIVELLLEYGAKDDCGIVLAYLAANKEIHMNTIKQLLEQVTIKADDRQWLQNAVNGASESGRIDIVKLLLEYSTADDLGWALVLAIVNKHNDIVDLLLEHGAQVDDENWSYSLYQPPLVTAVERGDSCMVKLLLEHGAKQGYGWALTKAILNENAELIQMLSEYGAEADDSDWFELAEPALVTASRDGSANIVKLLLEHGARKHHGLALTEAILNSHTEIIQLLSEQGAHMDDQNWSYDFDQPPLVIAVNEGDTNTVKLLLEHGAKQGLGRAITEAIWNEQTEIIQILSEHGAQVDDDDGYEQGNYDTPMLVMACKSGNSHLVKLLLEHGAKEHCRWALTEAILHKHTEVIDLLLEHGVYVADEGHRDESDIDPAIVEASENGDFDSVKLLLKYGEKKYLEWALSVAATTEIAELLIEHGAKVDEIDTDFGTTPLVEASELGNTNVVELLLNHGIKTYLPDALIKAIVNKHFDIIGLLTQHGARVDNENWFDFDAEPALVEASMEGDIEAVKLLLGHGAKKNLDWALEVASEKGHIKIIKLLLDFGIQLDDHSIFDTDALVEASKNGDTNTVKFLLKQGVVNRLGPALRAASGKGHTHIVNLLFEYGNAEDLGYALIEASQNGHTKVIKLLLERDVFVDFQDEEQTTALMVASQSGQIEAIKLLVEYGSQVNLQNINGMSALMGACQYGHTKAVEILLQFGAQVNVQDNNGLSTLMIVGQNGSTDIANVLLAHGAQVDLQNCKGWSPLMKASHKGHENVVELLLKHGANVNLQDNDGYHSLMAACQENHINVVKLLLNYGANINLEDKNGQTAVKVTNNDDIIALFASNNDDKSISELHEEAQREEEEEAHLIAIENAIKETGTLDHTLVHGVFVGPPRSGKDSLMKRLLGEIVPRISPSTGAVEAAIHVKVEESYTYAATIGQSNWTRLAYDEEALHLMKTASSSNSSTNCQFEGESTDSPVVEPPTAVEDNTSIGNAHKRTMHMQTDRTSDSSPEIDPRPVGFHDEKILQITKSDQSYRKSECKTPMEIFKEAIKKKGLEGFRKQLSNSWSLYLTNTGGQMEFQELLPLLVSGPSMFFITFPLHKDLNECFQVEYELPSGEPSKCYQSSLSILDSILQTLSTIAAMGTFVYKGLQKKCVPLKPKIFLIGTHKDLLDKESAATVINNIDAQLQTVIKSTSHYREEIIKFASKSRMIFTVSNLDPSDSDFQKVRSAVKETVEKGDYKMRSPAHWMIYSLVVRQLQNRVESYDECFAIAKECGVKVKSEFNEALHFIHTKMGLIRYFPHEELKDLVIVDPQILFEKVTELIVETFTFDNVGKYPHETFKNKGVFALSDFERISSRSGQILPSNLFAKLLEHLRIAAPFSEDGKTKYFLPCALAHAPRQVEDGAQTSTLPQLLVTFQCGYCPKGIFGTLITYLITNEMKPNFNWIIITDKIYRDEVTLQVSPYDIITIRFLPTHLEITFIASNPDLPREHCTVERVCKEVQESVEKGIEMVTSAINYITAKHSFTFYCTSDSESCRNDPHPAKVMKYGGKLCSLQCNRLKTFTPLKLPPGYEQWQLDSTEVCYGLKYHCSSLICQLSEYAAKWKEIGTYLKFRQNELNNIEARPLLLNGAPKSWLSALISEWVEWAPGDSHGSTNYANLEDLKSAVSQAGLGVIAAELSLKQKTTVETGQPSVSGNKRKSTMTEEEPDSKKPRLNWSNIES